MAPATSCITIENILASSLWNKLQFPLPVSQRFVSGLESGYVRIYGKVDGEK